MGTESRYVPSRKGGRIAYDITKLLITPFVIFYANFHMAKSFQVIFLIRYFALVFDKHKEDKLRSPILQSPKPTRWGENRIRSLAVADNLLFNFCSPGVFNKDNLFFLHFFFSKIIQLLYQKLEAIPDSTGKFFWKVTSKILRNSIVKIKCA